MRAQVSCQAVPFRLVTSSCSFPVSSTLPQKWVTDDTTFVSYAQPHARSRRAIASELSWRANVSGCRKDSIEASFVTGHDFSRADNAAKTTWALAPATFRAECGPSFTEVRVSQAAFFQIQTQALSNAIATHPIPKLLLVLFESLQKSFQLLFIRGRTEIRSWRRIVSL